MKREIKDKNVSTEEDIVQKLGGKEMGLQELFEEYFQDELDHKNFKPSNIHIIAITSITGSLKTGKTIGEIIKEITKDLKERKPKSSYESNDMPLQQRDFSEATNKIEATAVANIERKIGNSNYWCIVSAGAPGIGKTRFGIELFDYIKQNWEPPEEWGDVHFEYLYMNFGNGFYLSGYDSELKLEVILGLWIAYAFFIEKKYDTTFQVFRSRALQYGKDIFIFDSVIYYYYESLKFSNNQKLFLYLHIDEFQMIDKWGAQNKTNQFFGNMIRCITKFTTEEYSTFIQPFLSGTAPRAIAKQREVTDTGGLPRALERLLDVCFKTLCDNGKEFFEKLNYDYDEIFSIVKSDLQEMYAINRKCLDNKGTTVRDLQTDGHFSLSPYGGQNLFLIEMPFFFVCIYNDILKIVDVNNNMYWQEWELFVAHHISFRVNLAIKMGKNELSLRNLHPGAYGTKENLDIVMKLKELGIYKSREQFPLNLNLTHGSEIPWNNGHCVVVNGTSAESSDIFYVMEDVSGVFYLIMGQNQWDYGSKKMTEKNVSDEDEKNFNSVEHSELQEYRDITIIFTTQPYEGSENLPEILIVSKDNFKSYFGPVFSARATFSLTRDINPNFWDINRLKNTIKGADKRQKLDFFPFDVQGTEIYAPDHLIEN
ncbi:hypothetical protein RhiirA1_540504 [Rhizophagus irregularis]|uniref:Crinkler family protein n=1 Tax=Rhizophagus irregularis TaxID=588596 RepID=A0A2N0R7W5_9GLOM|nr:hypothetical protein RhiirA1_540504 [Rhizophagus irregularis]